MEGDRLGKIGGNWGDFEVNWDELRYIEVNEANLGALRCYHI